MRKNDELETPEWVYKPLGHFDLDPCAGSKTNIASRNWNIKRGEDGLKMQWVGLVWCNPPFSQKETWINKMLEHNNGILLLPERGSAPWFGPLAYRLGSYFVMGKKINFIGGPSSNNLGSVLFPFGPDAVEVLKYCNLPGHFVTVNSFNPRNI